jgi:hypothetical protein
MDDATDQLQDPQGGRAATASLPKALLGWVLVLLVIAGLAAVSWPKIRSLMSPKSASAGVNRAGLPLAETARPGLAQPAVTFHPRPAPKNYPPCTATRTDSCVQQDPK